MFEVIFFLLTNYIITYFLGDFDKKDHVEDEESNYAGALKEKDVDSLVVSYTLLNLWALSLFYKGISILMVILLSVFVSAHLLEPLCGTFKEKESDSFAKSNYLLLYT